jgi:small subunit ribosomal protein S13
MLRIASVIINEKKQAKFALTPIIGIGKNNVKLILKALNIDPTSKLGDLDDEARVKLRNYIETEFLVEADLKRQKQANIKRLIDINCHRGIRHKLRLPVRGQTTRTNSRTVRGNKKTTGVSGRPKVAKK